MVRLQRAAAASHQRGQLIEAIRVDAAVALAPAGIVVTLIGHGRTTVSIIGAAWFVVSAFFLRRVASSTARQGALLQEMFDTELFYLPWRPTVAGDEVPEPDVRPARSPTPEPTPRRTSASRWLVRPHRRRPPPL